MSSKSKKIFLALSIIIPFLLYGVYYYSTNTIVDNAPYKFSEFESLTLKYGMNDNLINQYDSKTTQYQYVNQDDSLIKKKVELSKDDLLLLHRRAVELGFWRFPDEIVNEVRSDRQIPHYFIEFKYKTKTKAVNFDLDFNGDPKLKDAVTSLIQEISSTIKAAEDKLSK